MIVIISEILFMVNDFFLFHIKNEKARARARDIQSLFMIMDHQNTSIYLQITSYFGREK